MPYTEPFVYLRANGFFGASAARVESWSVGFKLLQPNGTVPTASLTAFLETVSGPFQTFHAATNLKAGANVFLDELTAAVVGVDGKYVGGGSQTTVRRPFGTPIAGASSAGHPFSTAVVLSLRTTLSRGRASNGRAYWPNTGNQLDVATGLMTSTTTAQIAGVAGTLLTAINQAADTILPENLGVWVMSNLDSGISAPVTSVRVGSKFDSQESRERDLIETYSSVAVNSVPVVRSQLRALNVGEVQTIER